MINFCVKTESGFRSSENAQTHKNSPNELNLVWGRWLVPPSLCRSVGPAFAPLLLPNHTWLMLSCIWHWHVQKFDKIAWQSWPAGFRRCEGSRTWHKLRRTSSFDPQTTLTVQRGSKCVKIDQIWNRTFQLKKSKNHRCSYAQALFLDSLVRTKVPACKRVGGGVGCPLGWRYRGQFCPNFGFYRSDRKNDKNLQKNSKR